MKEDKFIKENSHIWSSLENTLNLLKAKSFKNIDKSEFDKFLYNYNRACSHLSYSRTYYGNTATTEYLNRLVAIAHSYIYTTRKSTVKSLLNFFAKDFSLLVQQNYKFFIVSMSLFLLGTLVSFIYTVIQPENASAFIPQELLDQIDFNNNSSSNWEGPVESTFILTNNTKVGFFSFAFGVTLGLGTAWVLIYNGFMLGTLAGLAFIKGFNLKFWSLILPHGILELFAIFVCGAAGLIIGYSLINPGASSRKDSFIIKGKTAIKLVCGTIPIFFIAGFIEGFITPRSFPAEYKLIFALFTLIVLLAYLIFPSIISKILRKRTL